MSTDPVTAAAVSTPYAEKRSHLESIDDEVNGLHPLLKQVFHKLKGITSVEYTHGVWERGADFVLHKHDATLNQTTYVGVIAKIGAIKSDQHDVERQIDECSLERPISGGRQKVFLNEIWVVATGNISENAKDKIHGKYRARNISFVGAEKLIELIDATAPYFWLDVGVELGHYLAKLRVRMSDLDAQSTLLSGKGSSYYIEPDISRRDPKEYEKRFTKSNNVNLQNEILNKQICLVEGQMGSGKSHLLRALASHFASNEMCKTHGWVPVFSDWRSFVEKHASSLDSLFDSELGVLSTTVERKLVFLDGLDEMAGASDERNARTLSANVINDVRARTNVKLVIATRPSSIAAEVTRLSQAGVYEIEPLSFKKLIQFVTRVCQELNLSKRLLEDIKKSDLFRRLPQTPIAAVLLSKLLAENQRELPSNLTELYAQSLEHMLGRWDMKKGLSTQKEYEAAEQICFRLATYLLDNNLVELGRDEARNMAIAYLRERNLDLDPDKVFSGLIERSGVISLDADNAVIRFRHRSFAEFLYAKARRAGAELAIDNRAFDMYWSNTFFFYMGLWKDCPDILRALISLKPANEGERWLKLFNMPNYYLAAFSSPYEVIEQDLYKLFIDAAAMYQDILEGRTETQLTALSEMQLIWVMQSVVRGSYSYAFFAKALDAVRIQIEDAPAVSPATKAIAQFFVGVTGLDLGEAKPFDFLIERRDVGTLPVSISYAIMQESESGKGKELHSTILRKRNKKFRQLLKQNKGLSLQLKKKFQTAIENLLPKRPEQKRLV